MRNIGRRSERKMRKLIEQRVTNVNFSKFQVNPSSLPGVLPSHYPLALCRNMLEEHVSDAFTAF